MIAQGDGFVPSESEGLPCDGETEVVGEGVGKMINSQDKIVGLPLREVYELVFQVSGKN